MLKVAIVGSTGLVGMEIIDVLFEEGLLENIHFQRYFMQKTIDKKHSVFYNIECFLCL